MHREIRQNLEDYLKGDGSLKDSATKLPAEVPSHLPGQFHAHLEDCEQCARELQLLERQSKLLRSLRSPTEIEPRAGFYARVVERIEVQPASIWSVFLDRKFGLRLAVVSAALVALLATYLVVSEPGGPEFATSPSVVYTDPPQTAQASIQKQTNRADQIQPDQPQADQPQADQQDGLKQEQQRDAVLVNLASYRP